MKTVEPMILGPSALILLKRTARALGFLLKAFGTSFGLCAIGGAVAPLVALGMMLGMLPNIVKAAFTWLLAAPLLLLLPLHAVYALGVLLSGRSPDYGKGIYGAAEWVEANRLYDPTDFTKKPDAPPVDQASSV